MLKQKKKINLRNYEVTNKEEMFRIIKSIAFIIKEEKIEADYWVKEFVNEASTPFEIPNRYDFARLSKLIISIEALFAINSIKVPQCITDFIKDVKDNISSKIASKYLETSYEVDALLRTLKFRKFEDSIVYFSDKKTYDKLLFLKFMFNKTIEKYANTTDKRIFAFNNIVNLLNTSDPARKYKIKYHFILKQINKEKTVDKYLKGNYEIWVNTQNKDYKEHINTHSFDEQTLIKKEYEHQKKLKVAKDELNYILNNRDNLEVKIIDFKNKADRAILTCYYKTYRQDRYLRMKAPNVLWLEPEPFREDWSVDKFIDSATNAFGSVYYREKV